MTPILEARQLFKHYDSFTAVNGVDLSIPAGICYGLLGPNGAGKTTTVEMLEGIREPSAGEIFFRGKPLDREFRFRAGIQFQHTSLQDFLTVHETLVMFAQLYPDSLPLDEIIEQCALADILDRDNRKLSGGQKQRLLLALALVNDPDMIFLDEPTTGLDPQSRRNFWELIRGIKARGKTILLTTHYMEEAEILCDTIAIMDQGQIVEEGAPQTLIKKHFNSQLIELPYLPSVELQLEDSGLTYQHVDDRIEITTHALNETLHQLIKANIPMQNCTIRQYNLEDLFIKLTGHSLRE